MCVQSLRKETAKLSTTGQTCVSQELRLVLQESTIVSANATPSAG
jgi:hypothetical protein